MPNGEGSGPKRPSEGEAPPGRLQETEQGKADTENERPPEAHSKEAALRDIDDRVRKIDAEIAISNSIIPPLQQERRRFTREVDSLEERQRMGERLSAGEQERLRLFQSRIEELRRKQRDEELYIRELEGRKEALLALRKDIE